MKAAPARALPGEFHLALLLFMLLVLNTALVVLCLRFLCPAKCGHRLVAVTAHAQVKGYKKDPYFCTPTPLLPSLTRLRFQMSSWKGVKNRLYSTDAYQCMVHLEYFPTVT